MKIFVGSTVKDLEDLRDQLYYKIKAWGHTPLLSEFPDFPSLYHSDSKTNCLRVVDDCDFFILLLDKRAGIFCNIFPESGDSRFSGKTITEAEFLRARELKKPFCILIRERTFNESAIYKQIKDAFDVSEIKWYADIAVFEFIERLMHYGLTPWIYQFGKSEDVFNIIPLVFVEYEKLKEKNLQPYSIPIASLYEEADAYQKEIEFLKDTIAFSWIKDIWNFFDSHKLTGKYTLEETMQLLNQVKPPFPWFDSICKKYRESEDSGYKATKIFLDNIRSEIAKESLTPGSGPKPIKRSLFPNTTFPFSEYFDENLAQLWGWVGEDITTVHLQCYFYSNKKNSDLENVEDIIVNLIILFMMAFSMWRYEKYNHGEMLDSILANKSPWDDIE